MTKVFIAGSRRVSRLPVEVKRRIDTMVNKAFQILVGDANGADKAVQLYLATKSYPNVLVHCMKGHCRNNVGEWTVQEVSAPKGARGFDFYSLKDKVMADSAEYGLMLWDGKSKGTINNIANLARQSKRVVVYIAPTKSFETVRALDDLKEVLAQGDPKSVSELVTDLSLGAFQPLAFR